MIESDLKICIFLNTLGPKSFIILYWNHSSIRGPSISFGISVFSKKNLSNTNRIYPIYLGQLTDSLYTECT